jgi:hypothetical protein
MSHDGENSDDSVRSHKDFFANKNPKFIGTVKKGKYHGTHCQEFRKDKSVRYEGGFEDGKWSGPGKKTFKNGQPEFTGSFVNGMFHGPDGCEYRDDGTKRYEGDFEDGKWHGQGTKYFDNEVKNFYHTKTKQKLLTFFFD